MAALPFFDNILGKKDFWVSVSSSIKGNDSLLHISQWRIIYENLNSEAQHKGKSVYYCCLCKTYENKTSTEKKLLPPLGMRQSVIGWGAGWRSESFDLWVSVVENLAQPAMLGIGQKVAPWSTHCHFPKGSLVIISSILWIAWHIQSNHWHLSWTSTLFTSS
jgi:CRISPR/Cas system CSM-associated protein Csm5 (group 7 of RAMP superfamily)